MRKYNIHILLIVIASILYFFVHFQRTAIPAPIFDMLQLDLNATASQITALSAIFMYSYAIGTLFSGMLIDKFGGIRVFVCGSIIFAIGSLLFANISYLPLLYLARSLIGLGASTFYLSILSEVKKCFADKYFGIVIAVVLFVGYLGGIFANAPFTILSDKFGWQSALNIMSIVIVSFTVFYITIQRFLKHLAISKRIKLSIRTYLEVFKNKKNIPLYVFYVFCTSIHYTMMAVIGAKFLHDFMKYSTQKAAFILSILVIIAACSGIFLSTICKMLNNNRLLFVKIIAHATLFILGTISLLVFLQIKTILIPVLILILALSAGNTPISVPLIVNINQPEIRSTALSLANSFAFIAVGIFATIIGLILESFPIVEKINGHNVYSPQAYLTVFIIFTMCAALETFATYKIRT